MDLEGNVLVHSFYKVFNFYLNYNNKTYYIKAGLYYDAIVELPMLIIKDILDRNMKEVDNYLKAEIKIYVSNEIGTHKLIDVLLKFEEDRRK